MIHFLAVSFAFTLSTAAVTFPAISQLPAGEKLIQMAQTITNGGSICFEGASSTAIRDLKSWMRTSMEQERAYISFYEFDVIDSKNFFMRLEIEDLSTSQEFSISHHFVACQNGNL